MEESQIIEQVKCGNQSAFDYLVRSYKDMVHSLCVSMLSENSHHDDVVQKTFIKVYKNINGFDGRSGLKTWLYRIAYNKCLDEIRRSKRFRLFKSVFSDKPISPNYQSDDEISRLVRKSISSLPEKDRAVVTLFYLEQLKLSEISMILGDSESSLKMRLSRARKKLKTDISKKYEGEIEDIIYG